MAVAASIETQFSSHTWVLEWPELVVAASELEAKLRRVGRPIAADMVLAAYGEFRDRLLLLGQDIASVDDVAILYPDGAIQGKKDRVRLRMDASYMKMAAEGKL